VTRVAAVVAVVLFAVALVLFLTDAGDSHLIEGLTLGGFTSLAAAHAL
jgi:hypothetical protein